RPSTARRWPDVPGRPTAAAVHPQLRRSRPPPAPGAHARRTPAPPPRRAGGAHVAHRVLPLPGGHRAAPKPRHRRIPLDRPERLPAHPPVPTPPSPRAVRCRRPGGLIGAFRMQFTEATSTVTIDASLVARALPFRAYNDVRYYLNGVLIEPEPTGGVNVIATDGHAMICLHDPAGRATRRLILPIGKAQATPLRKGGKLHATSDGRAYITGVGGEILWISPELAIEGKYPNTKKLVGNVADYVPGFAAAMNPALLARLHEARPRGPGIARP